MSTEQPSVAEKWPPQHAVIDKWFEEQSPDIILQVEGFRLPCHKEVLMNQSEYFKVSRQSHYHILTVLYNNMMHSLWCHLESYHLSPLCGIVCNVIRCSFSELKRDICGNTKCYFY